MPTIGAKFGLVPDLMNRQLRPGHRGHPGHTSAGGVPTQPMPLPPPASPRQAARRYSWNRPHMRSPRPTRPSVVGQALPEPLVRASLVVVLNQLLQDHLPAPKPICMQPPPDEVCRPRRGRSQIADHPPHRDPVRAIASDRLWGAERRCEDHGACREYSCSRPAEWPDTSGRKDLVKRLSAAKAGHGDQEVYR